MAAKTTKLTVSNIPEVSTFFMEFEEVFKKDGPQAITYRNASDKEIHNTAFHRKLFALFNVGFEYWEPGEISCKYGVPEKNFNQYRGDVTILAGYYEVYTRLDGSTRVVPKSLKYEKMSDDEKEKLYSSVINVLLKHIFNGYTEEEVIRMATGKILGFA